MLRGLRSWVFTRHANPVSAWSRWASTPLVLVPLWTRRWSHAGVVGVWMVANAVVFPKPHDDAAWATKAMRGEEIWIEQRPFDIAMALNAAATGFGMGAAVAAWRRAAGVTVAATIAEMALLLAYWHHMVSYYERQGHSGNTRAQCGLPRGESSR